MKLTQKLEKEVMQVYNAYWSGYMNGDMKAFADYLDDDVKVIGSTEDEVFFNKKDALSFYQLTADQIAGKAELRNRIIKVEPAGDLVLITEQSDFYILMEDNWTFYAKGRLSTLLQKKDDGWKVIQQHGSMPDIRAKEGEQFALEKISKENLELRDAVKRRTVELEQKNKELEIETALERVRAESMGMKKPDDILAICKVMFKELQLLGFSQLRNTLINFWDDNSSSLIDYDYSDDTGGNKAKLSYSSHPVFEQFQQKIKNSKDAFAELVVTEDKLESWKQRRRDSGEYEDPRLNNIIALYYYFYSIGVGAIGISTFSSITDDQLNVLKRFRNVFDFAYRRYADVAQAEAQAREAEIELALERVRARTMAMQNSNELPEAANLLFQQAQTLGMPAWSAGYCIWDEDKQGITLWMSSEAVIQPSFHAPLTKDPSFIHMREAYERKQDFHVEEVGGNELVKHYKYMRTLPVVGKVLDSIIEAGHPLPTFQIFHCVYFSQGFLLFITYEPVPEAHEVFKRFAKVFEQTYTRFLDLQKAEAQAREAQIQLALERVRARTMAMQKSDELPETSHILFEQMKELGEPVEQLTIGIVQEENNVIEISATLHGDTLKKIYLHSIDEPYMMTKVYKAWKTQQKTLIVELKGDELNSYNKYRNELTNSEMFPTNLGDEHRRIVYAAFFSKGMLALGANEPRPPQSLQLLERFASVFDLTYTRFLDLQKAETQAREAAIELGLERVRARAMAMQHSDELAELVTVVFNELTHLDFHITSSIIWINNPETLTNTLWVTSAEMNQPAHPIQLSPFHHNFFHSIIHAWKEKDPQWIYLLTGNEKSNFEKSFFKGAPGLPKALKSALSVPEKVVFSATFNNFGALELIGTEPLADEKFDILHRFGNVFNSSYTRFNDLKKAETQAREATIEAALERVRARTMAMQKSTDLGATSALLFAQLNALIPELWTCGFVLCDKNKTADEWWLSGGSGFMPDLILPNVGDALHYNIYQAWLNGELYHEEVITGAALQQHYEWLMTIPSARAAFDAQAAAGINKPVWQQLSCAYFSKGYLVVITEKPCAEAAIFKRFAQVFEQTYTRFLDLQKAEASAREAEIELGLERVRARAMAMQKSDELSDLVDTVFKELTKLDFALNWCIINIIDEPSLTNMVWAANPETNKPPESYLMKFEDYPFHHSMLKGYQERKTNHVYVIEGKEKTTYDNYLFNETEWRRVPKAAQDASRAMKRYVATFSFSNFGGLQTVGEEYLSEENLDILSRFGKVFDLTYTRFNDLQKAEAQAREAEIQLALERVRARSLAMHHTSELQEIVKVVAQQLQHMGLNINGGVFITINEELDQDIQLWASLGAADYVQKVFVPLFDRPIFTQLRDAIKKGNNFFDETYSKEEKDEMFHHLFHFSPWNELSKERRNELLSREGGLTRTAAISQNTSIVITNHNGNRFSDQEIEILKRFGSVFEQTYTRFLDLQKAEAQARDSQIELALERVRARTMAMQKSDELAKAAQLLYEEFRTLNIKTFLCGYCFYKEEQDKQTVWVTLPDGTIIPDFVDFPITGDDVLDKRYLDWKQKKPLHIFELQGEKNKKHHRFLSSKVSDQTANEIFAQIPDRIIFYCANFSTGYLFIIATEFLKEEEENVIIRFGKVFEQTYTRFLDLQKAEVQAREAKIEAALERVRSRSMGMQKSEELKDVIKVVYEQLVHLNIKLNHAGFVVDYTPKGGWTFWIADEHDIPSKITHPWFESVWANQFNEAKEKGADFFATYLDFEEKNKFYNELLSYVPGLPQASRDFYLNCPALAASTVLLDNVSLYIENFDGFPYADEENKILMRFAKVFQQTYTRFLDLQKAEAQAREAQIEAALERVRSRTMAMQHSNELLDVASILFQQVKALGVPQWNCGFNIWNIGDKEFTYYPGSPDGIISPSPCKIPLTEHPVFMRFDESRRRGDELFIYEKGGEEQADHYRYMLTLPGVGDLLRSMLDAGFELPKFQIDHLANFSYGNLLFITYEHFPEMHDVFKRFAKVFEQTYTRFLDLQKAEAQAREAQIETGLERVRSRTMAMQHSDELSETAAVLFNEFKKLGNEELIQVTIGIYNEAAGTIEFRATSWAGGGEQISHPFNLSIKEPTLLQPTFNAWKAKKRSTVVDLTGEKLEDWINYRNANTGVTVSSADTQGRRVVTAAFFSKGHLSISSPLPLQKDTVKTLERFAAVFDSTYTRFNDLKKAEAQAEIARLNLIQIQEEKQRAEVALTELQATQKQLIQSEKMASLGELTAGIAHEIQNPLNFVNNFSDVSTELIDEMNEEIAKGNLEDARQIAADLKQNLKKINHHGKRAGDIVKGMLQHSRSTNNATKEPTDINKLADEYLRLAYHGLRAKDKSFNATLKTDFDESIGNINIFPQDIGRVILNLITNAFYAVGAPQPPKGGVPHAPTVYVSTKKMGDKVLISVRDNGPGIPEKILDKIFQPFFTTKPTGQGTGLGLSLSYDIVKAHGGELKVETKEGEGAEFIIILPL